MQLDNSFNDNVAIIMSFITLVGGLIAIIAGIRTKIIPKLLRLYQVSGVLFTIADEFEHNNGSVLSDLVFKDSLLIEILLDESNMPIFYCNKSGECTYANKALLYLFNLDKTQILGRGWLSAIDENQRFEVWQEWQDAVKEDIPYNVNYILTNGKICRSLAYPQRNKGKLIGIAVTVCQITNVPQSTSC